jgi:hypothetical protein
MMTMMTVMTTDEGDGLLCRHLCLEVTSASLCVVGVKGQTCKHGKEFIKPETHKRKSL